MAALPLLALLLVLAPASAQAATVAVDGGVLRVTAAPAEQNSLSVAPAPAAPELLAVSDAGAALVAGTGCVPADASTPLTCAGAASLEIDLGDGDDRLLLAAPMPSRAEGGPGDDGLTGGPGEDELLGGDGRDSIDPEGGADAVDGGSDADSIVVRDGRSETAWCGSGPDRVQAEVVDQLDVGCERVDYGPPGGVGRVRHVTGGGRFVPIPGQPWARVDRRILADVLHLVARYHVHVGDGYATLGHTYFGEHPLGLAVDLFPGPGGSWRDVDRLARWAEPRQGRPRRPFRWVGYNGDYNHGNVSRCSVARGCSPHLHLSWAHSPGRPLNPVRTVWVWQVLGP